MFTSTDLLVWTVILGIECLAIVVGNAITIAVFWKQRSLSKRTCYLLINLSIVDALVGFTGIETVVNNVVRLKTSQTHLSWQKYSVLDKLFSFASLLFLLLISLERLHAVVWPFRHRSLTTRSYFCAILAGWCWSGASIFISSLPDIFPENFHREYFAWVVTGSIVVCTIFIACAYSTIWIYTRRNDPRLPRNRREQNKALAKTLFIATSLSMITWVPFGVLYVLAFILKSKDVSLNITYVGRALQLANSLINPLVYCFRMPEFRHTIKSFFINRNNVVLQTTNCLQQADDCNVPVQRLCVA